MSPTQHATQQGLSYSEGTDKFHKKSKGQYFTPPEVAHFMASLAGVQDTSQVKVCDPGCGHAILTCSLTERLVELGAKSIHADLFETDEALLPVIQENLEFLSSYCAQRKVSFTYNIVTENFLLYTALHLEEMTESYDVVISNPPYFKLNKDDPNITAVSAYVEGITNIYAGFIAASVKICKVSGECVFIVPRSFTAGLYFKSLRGFLFRETRIRRVHLFASRTKTFKADKVLQETVIFKTNNNEGTTTEVSVSEGINDLGSNVVQSYQISDLVDLQSEDKVLHLPESEEDFELIQRLRTLEYRLIDHGIKVSTGRVVAFRAKEFIQELEEPTSVPFIWGDNIKTQLLQWPLSKTKRAQFIDSAAGKLLVPIGNYVVQRRFSAKEDKKRLVCAPLIGERFRYEDIGLENKTNFFYRIKAAFTIDQVVGLSALLNSSIYDRYFRLINGNINVSATEMRLLPMPALAVIEQIGQRVAEAEQDIELIDEIVAATLFADQVMMEAA